VSWELLPFAALWSVGCFVIGYVVARALRRKQRRYRGWQ
jgi:ABC-type spermidine/putrescine transport system permease subunit I